MTPAESASNPYPDALPVGTALGEFTISEVIGVGGFGIVYTAHDTMLDRTVAIKEYYPVTIAGRANADNSVLVRALSSQDAYAAGVQSFLQEARLQARFSHPAMLEVYRVWEQNATAYMAMRYYPGASLRTLRLDPASALIFDEASIRQITSPIFDALHVLHSQSVLHRDVSPDNILMLPSGAPVLLDFGAARSVVAGAPQSFTTVLKPGYAPIEQYADDGTMEQGPWTDVYALGAVLHFLAVGTPPSQAVTRIMGGTLKAFENDAAGRFSDAFIVAVKAALEVHGHDRVQSVAAFREALGWISADSDDRPVSMLLTLDSFPPQTQRTQRTTTRAANTATAAKTAAASETALAAKTGKTEQAATAAPNAAPTSSKKIATRAENSTRLLSPAHIEKVMTQTLAHAPASSPSPAPAPSPVRAAAAVSAEPAALRPPTLSPPALPPAKADAATRSATKAARQTAAPKALTKPPLQPARPAPRLAASANAPTAQPRRVRNVTVMISLGVVLSLAAAIYVGNARKVLSTSTQATPQLPTPSASPDVLIPAAPTAIAAPAPVVPPTPIEAARNALDIEANAAPKAADINRDNTHPTTTLDPPARTTPRQTQAQRAFASGAENRVTASAGNQTDATAVQPPKVRSAAKSPTAPEICGQILAKLSLGGSDISDSERNQLRGCK